MNCQVALHCFNLSLGIHPTIILTIGRLCSVRGFDSPIVGIDSLILHILILDGLRVIEINVVLKLIAIGVLPSRT